MEREEMRYPHLKVPVFIMEWAGPEEPLLPERLLWMWVIHRAVKDALMGPSKYWGINKFDHRTALWWLFDTTDRTYQPAGFWWALEHICIHGDSKTVGRQILNAVAREWRRKNGRDKNSIVSNESEFAGRRRVPRNVGGAVHARKGPCGPLRDSTRGTTIGLVQLVYGGCL